MGDPATKPPTSTPPDIREKAVPAEAASVSFGLVGKDETWRFDATGDWKDWFVSCGPDGYRLFAAYVLDIRPQMEDAPFFCLCGMLAGRPETMFRIGHGGEHTFKDGGELVVFANDLPSKRGNNTGEVLLRAERMAGPSKPTALGWWTLLRETLDRTTGLLFVAALAIGVSAALAFLPQGQDLVRTVSEEPFRLDYLTGPQVLFAATLLFLAIQAWFWPRAIITFNYGSNRDDWGPARPVLEWTPRVLGLVAFALVGWATIRNAGAQAPLALATVLVAAGFFVFVLRRQDLWNRVRQRAMVRRGKPPPRVGRAWVLACLALAVVMMALLSVAPVGPARMLGAPGVIFLGVGLLIPPLVLLIQTGAPVRFPVLGTLILLAALFSLWVDNHQVGRRVGLAPMQARVDGRQTIDKAYETWRAQFPAQTAKPLPIVLVAAEGGASRAGFWTGQVLSELHRRSGGELARSLFAVSSISGGSVGAVGYVAALHEGGGADVEPRVAAFTGADALSPAVGGLLYPDLLQRFLPAAVPILPDRAEGLERSWEKAWAQGCQAGKACEPDLMRRPFLDLWRTRRQAWLPLVIVNGASEETGRPILTSPVAFQRSEIDADDFYGIQKADVRASTAIHNGARFPYISPAGTLVASGQDQGHVVDGGYFDPAGVETVRQLMRQLEWAAAIRGDKLDIIVVFAGYRGATAEEDRRARPTHRLANETLAPLLGLLSSRDAHAAHLVELLKTDIAGEAQAGGVGLAAGAQSEGLAANRRYLPILLCDVQPAEPPKPWQGRFEMPMDWALSRQAQGLMRRALVLCPNNDAALTEVAAALRP